MPVVMNFPVSRPKPPTSAAAIGTTIERDERGRLPEDDERLQREDRQQAGESEHQQGLARQPEAGGPPQRGC